MSRHDRDTTADETQAAETRAHDLRADDDTRATDATRPAHAADETRAHDRVDDAAHDRAHDRVGDDTADRTTTFDQRIHEDERLAREEYVHRDAADPAVAAAPVAVSRHEVVAAEREQFGGVKLGSAFFGWLTAMGTAVLLTALLAAAGTAVSLSEGTTASEAAADAVDDPASVGIIGAVALGVVIFVAYYCGGYVAGRMARFDGARQGVAVWLWAVIVALVVAILGVVAGEQFNVLAQLDGFPRFPVGEGDVTTAGIVAVVIVLLTSLVGAILGGLAGMRFHRRVDRAGLGD